MDLPQFRHWSVERQNTWVFFRPWLLLVKLLSAFVWKFLCGHGFQAPRNKRAGSHVNFIRNCQITFQSGCTILYSHKQCMRVPVTLYPGSIWYCQYAYFSHSNRYIAWVMVWIFISHLMDNNVEHLFMYLITIFISSREVSVQVLCSF